MEGLEPEKWQEGYQGRQGESGRDGRSEAGRTHWACRDEEVKYESHAWTNASQLVLAEYINLRRTLGQWLVLRLAP